MLVAVSSRVIYEVPDTDDPDAIRARFHADLVFIRGDPIVSPAGQTFILRTIENLEVKRAD